MLALYTDGGLASANPSSLAGSWAWVLVADDAFVSEDCGFIRAGDMPDGRVTSNQVEFYAVLQGLQNFADSVDVAVYMDSEVTYRRVAEMGARVGIPDEWYHVMGAQLRRHRATFHLLAGHPSIVDLERGTKANGTPVSKWNIRADNLCKMAANVGRLVVLSEQRTEDESYTVLQVTEREYGRNHGSTRTA